MCPTEFLTSVFNRLVAGLISFRYLHIVKLSQELDNAVGGGGKLTASR